MREFKPSKKGVILFDGKEYKIKVDDKTISLLMLTCVSKIDRIKGEIAELEAKVNSGDITIDSFVDTVSDKLNVINEQSARFCKISLGHGVFDDMRRDGCFSDEDVVDLTGLIMEEIVSIRNEKNNKLKECVSRFD